MSNDKLLNIGAFSVLTGLSIPALRHYDDVGLLRPVSVSRNAYRRYGLEQVATGRLIHALRAIDLPIEAVREVIAADDADGTRAVLVDHRARLSEHSRDVAQMIDTLDEYLQSGVPMTKATGCRIIEINIGVDDLERARQFYEAVFEVEFTEEHHGEGPRHLFAASGCWPSDEFFLLNISDARRDPYRSGRADFGFLVDDLEAVHQRAVAQGGTEISAPADFAGMPRASTIVDPSGNLINRYQNA